MFRTVRDNRSQRTCARVSRGERPLKIKQAIAMASLSSVRISFARSLNLMRCVVFGKYLKVKKKLLVQSW